jgi:hypothetical protein
MKTSKLNQVGNFGKLVSFTNAQGPVYNPGKASIKVTALQTLLAQAQGAIKAADVSRTAYENAINARQAVIVSIPILARRIVAVLKSNGAPPEVMEDVMTIKRRFSTRPKTISRGTPLPTSAANGQATEANSQHKHSYLDYESMIGNFQRLVIRATAEPTYQVNEADLKADVLTKIVASLQDKHQKVTQALRAMREADQAVNRMLYDNVGIYGTAVATKAYIEALYGFRSEQYKEVILIKFKSRR